MCPANNKGMSLLESTMQAALAQASATVSPSLLPAPAPLPRGATAYWPLGLLEAFTLQMASHGLSVSGCLMMGDRRYALDQLVHAHSLADDALHDMAMALFKHLEQHQSGISPFRART